MHVNTGYCKLLVDSYYEKEMTEILRRCSIIYEKSSDIITDGIKPLTTYECYIPVDGGWYTDFIKYIDRECPFELFICKFTK